MSLNRIKICDYGLISVPKSHICIIYLLLNRTRSTEYIIQHENKQTRKPTIACANVRHNVVHPLAREQA